MYSYLNSYVLVGVVLCVICRRTGSTEKTPKYILTSYPVSPADEDSLTLSCEENRSQVINTVVWYINKTKIFQTSDINNTILDPQKNSSEYHRVQERIQVNSTSNQHNVTLRINATLDDGTVWQCKSGQTFSNNVTVLVTDQGGQTGTSQQPYGISQTDSSDTAPSGSGSTGKSMEKNMKETEKDKSIFGIPKNIYIIAGVGAGFVLIISVLVVAICVGVRRKKRCHKGKAVEEDNKVCHPVHNKQAEEDDLVMVDNAMYAGYSDEGDADNGSKENKEPSFEISTDEQRKVTDVYAQVNKAKKKTIQTGDVNTKSKKGQGSVHSYSNVKVNTPEHEENVL